MVFTFDENAINKVDIFFMIMFFFTKTLITIFCDQYIKFITIENYAYKKSIIKYKKYS